MALSASQTAYAATVVDQGGNRPNKPSSSRPVSSSTDLSGATKWLTITGDSENDQVDTIMVAPTPVEVHGNVRAMSVRVSRAKVRTNPDGIKFRSFEALTEFDCDKRTARYVRTEFYEKPLWNGSPFTKTEYSKNDVRYMAFRDVTPNPNVRIIKAVCSIKNVASR